MVVTLLPPPPDSATQDSSSSASSSSAGSAQQQGPLKPTQQAVFYRPGDLKPQLQVPLGVTVPAKAPTPDTIPADQGRTIDALTLNNLFQASIQQDQILGVNMVLDRPKTG
jgi:hypothetical protein